MNSFIQPISRPVVSIEFHIGNTALISLWNQGVFWFKGKTWLLVRVAESIAQKEGRAVSFQRRPTVDFRSNLSSESRTKLVYEHFMKCTDDHTPGSTKFQGSPPGTGYYFLGIHRLNYFSLTRPLANFFQWGFDRPALAGKATIRSSQSVSVLICSFLPCMLHTISILWRQTRKVLVVYLPKKCAMALLFAEGLKLGRTVIAVNTSSSLRFFLVNFFDDHPVFSVTNEVAGSWQVNFDQVTFPCTPVEIHTGHVG